MADSKLPGLNLEEGYLVVAAIDFGTTFSGYAFSFKTDPGTVVVGKYSNPRSLKTPTSVLTNPDGSLKSFGYEAEEEYRHCEPNDGYEMFRGFKMALENQDLSESTMVQSITGKSRTALDIIAMTLEYIKSLLLATINKSLNERMDDNQIRWVLTVPAIWTEKAKQFMRQTAFQAGLITELDSKRLLIALEPEAASFYCRSMAVNNFGKDGKFTTGDKMLIIDAGGGTVDIVAHELLITGEVKELTQPSGGPWGGIGVNRKFHEEMAKIFSQDFINHIKSKFPQNWFDFCDHFETSKKAFDGKRDMRIQLPHAFHEQYLKLTGKPIETGINESPCKDVKMSNGYLILNTEKVASYFKSSCKKIVKQVRKILEKPELTGLQHMVLVGGYGESPVLYDACYKAFGKQCKVLVPLNAQTAIIQGAVLFGHQPTLISSRLARSTYGCQADLLFEDAIHDPSRRYKSKRNGQIRCRGTFREFVKKGEELRNPDVRIFPVHPKSNEETRIIIPIWKSEKETVLYCDEEGVTKVGQIKLKSPHRPLGEDIEVRVTFGHTEIMVEAQDTSKGDGCFVKSLLEFSGN